MRDVLCRTLCRLLPITRRCVSMTHGQEQHCKKIFRVRNHTDATYAAKHRESSEGLDKSAARNIGSDACRDHAAVAGVSPGIVSQVIDEGRRISQGANGYKRVAIARRCVCSCQGWPSQAVRWRSWRSPIFLKNALPKSACAATPQLAQLSAARHTGRAHTSLDSWGEPVFVNSNLSYIKYLLD